MKSKNLPGPGPWIIQLNKPVNIGSLDLVRELKRSLPRPFGKIGHFGTLDPFAEGVLVVAGDGAQKLNDYIHDWFPKTYEAVGVLGLSTPTGDMTEEGTRKKELDPEVGKLENSQIEELQNLWCQKFLGEYLQVPPQYSASKFEGKPMHFYARQGIKVEKEAVSRKIFSLKVLEVNFPEVKFEVEVSSGTYIRTLFEDMAKVLGTIGVLKTLKRTSVGPFKISNCYKLEDLNFSNWNWEKFLNPHIHIPMKSIFLNEKGSHLYGNGQRIRSLYFQRVEGENRQKEDFAWVFSSKGRLFGLGKVENDILGSEFNFPKPEFI